MAKKKKKQSTFDELEDVSMKLLVPMSGMLFGIIFAGIIKEYSLVGFMIGGAIGGALTYYMLYGFFVFFNPGRDRSKKK